MADRFCRLAAPSPLRLLPSGCFLTAWSPPQPATAVARLVAYRVGCKGKGRHGLFDAASMGRLSGPVPRGVAPFMTALRVRPMVYYATINPSVPGQDFGDRDPGCLPDMPPAWGSIWEPPNVALQGLPRLASPNDYFTHKTGNDTFGHFQVNADRPSKPGYRQREMDQVEAAATGPTALTGPGLCRLRRVIRVSTASLTKGPYDQ